MPRFERRCRKISDDGSDFRQFVGELLRETPGYGQPIAADSGSVDGAIDLFCDVNNAVFECKFIGASQSDETGRVLQEWKRISARLERNLKSSGAGGSTPRSPYMPWLDQDKPIKKYYFVVSAFLANLSQKRAIQSAIEEFFAALSKYAGLEHLAALAIKVIDWNELEVMAEGLPHLAYKWLYQLPSGFSPMLDAEQKGFKSYLNNNVLPYLSRSEVEAITGELSSWNEQTIIQEIRSDGATPQIIIGEGGVGKTRLALDLARRLKDSGYLVFNCDGPRITTAALRDLITSSGKSSKFLFVADYVEQWPGLDGFCAEAADISLQSGHSISILGTCRLSYRDRLPNRVRQWRIGGQGKFETEYAKEVCTHILRSAAIDGAVDLSTKCRSNLAIASFLAFLKSSRPDQFHSEVEALRRESSFESWIIRRLNSAGFEELASAAAIMAACSFPFDKLSALEAAHHVPARLTHTLIADRWIESSQGRRGLEWSSFHDLFADTLIAKSFELAPMPNYWAIKLLRSAFDLGVANQSLGSLARCVAYPAVDAVDWFSVVMELGSSTPEMVTRYARVLLGTPLLSSEERLKLLVTNQRFREEISADTSNDITIATLARDLREHEHLPGYWDCLIPLLEAMVDRSVHGNIALRVAFIAQPSHFKVRLKNYIAQYPTNFNTHYLLASWLYEAGPMALADPQRGEAYCYEILPHVREWLTVNPHETVASFIFSPWLAAALRIGGPAGSALLQEVYPHIAEWLQKGSVAGGAQFQNFARFFIGATESLAPELLHDTLSLIRPHIHRWFSHSENRSSQDCYKILVPLFIAAETLGGDERVVTFDEAEALAKQWVNSTSSALRRDAGSVYSHLLAASVKQGQARTAEVVDWWYPIITDWLSRFINEDPEVSRHIMDSLLFAASELSVMQRERVALELSSYLFDWLRAGGNSGRSDLALLYRNWINCAPLRLINDTQDLIAEWLPTEEDEEKFSLFVAAWQQRGLPFQTISSAVYDRFMKQRKNEGAAWLLKSIVREDALPVTISRAAAEWCAAFPENEDSLARLSNIVRRDGLDEVYKADIIVRVLNAQSIENVISSPFRLTAGRRLLSYLISAGKDDKRTRSRAREIFYDWLIDGRVFRPVKEFDWYPAETQEFDQRVSFLYALRELIASGELRPQLHSGERACCRSFAAWVSEWAQSRPHEVGLAVDDLTTMCGINNVWKIMLSQRHRLPGVE